MTDERLAEIEAREKAATPGPWVWQTARDVEPYEPDRGLASEEFCSPAIIVAPNVPEGGESSTWVLHAMPNCLPECVLIRITDAKFIAHARQDVHDLLAEVKRLKTATPAPADEQKECRYGHIFDPKERRCLRCGLGKDEYDNRVPRLH